MLATPENERVNKMAVKLCAIIEEIAHPWSAMEARASRSGSTDRNCVQLSHAGPRAINELFDGDAKR
jgi:hypothetical protein